ncbi:MAG: hypothetical protein RLZZ546_1973 [Bacteroidota bacterium]|jgi:predicted ATPase
MSDLILKFVRMKGLDESLTEFPFNLPIIKNLSTLHFKKPITCFVGENGSGKSTLLESIAAASNVPVAGSSEMVNDVSLEYAVKLSKYLTLGYGINTHHGLFTRAEDFIGFARSIKIKINDLQNEINEIIEGYKGGDLKLMTGPIESEKQQLINRYSADLEAMSHGEGFLKLFHSRMTSKGLYLMDEPEAALSPQRQLSLMYMINQKVEAGCQFIIATHSPLIMGMKNTSILSFDGDTISEVEYENTQHYLITKSFINNPDSYLDNLK